MGTDRNPKNSRLIGWAFCTAIKAIASIQKPTIRTEKRFAKEFIDDAGVSVAPRSARENWRIVQL